MEGIRSGGKISIQKSVWVFGALSALAHLLFLFAKAPSVSIEKALSPEETKIIVRLTSPETSKKVRQVVETEKSDSNLAKPKTAYLGKQNNSVLRETKAANVGSFKEAGQGVRNAHREMAAQLEKSLRKQTLEKLRFSDLAAKTAIKPMQKKKTPKMVGAQKGLKNGNKNKRGLSSSSDYLEEVPLGDFTRLNTQEFEFYGFYHRIRQKLEQFWGAKLQDQIEKIHKSGRSIASGQNLLTSLEIKMNARGEIVKIHLGSTSGIKELDDVAIESFNQAGPFPNPPQGMVKDGLATIKWGFAVQAN